MLRGAGKELHKPNKNGIPCNPWPDTLFILLTTLSTCRAARAGLHFRNKAVIRRWRTEWCVEKFFESDLIGIQKFLAPLEMNKKYISDWRAFSVREPGLNEKEKTLMREARSATGCDCFGFLKPPINFGFFFQVPGFFWRILGPPPPSPWKLHKNSSSIHTGQTTREFLYGLPAFICGVGNQALATTTE